MLNVLNDDKLTTVHIQVHFMILISIVTSLMLLQLFLFSFFVGLAREKYNINAPAISGHQDFERIYRVHQNTQEQLIITLPAMWVFAQFYNPYIAAILGVTFIIGRFVYSSSYKKDPKSRAIGFFIGVIPTGLLMIGSLLGGILEIFKKYQII